ncbi:DUF6284 family protein [Streptomyces sp. NPDC097619]|uniref:DUF6284 family protein n=1 Tax=Streptomyces sp. NPDC097619 TaxID=3157228 RepID=UPI003331E163
MVFIVALQSGVTRLPVDLEPTDAELAVIEAEMPVIAADVELLDALIVLLDRDPSEFDGRRVRRAYRKLLAARAAAGNRASGGAA